MKFICVLAAILAASVSVEAVAGPAMLYPVQTGAEKVRYRIGVPTLNLETPTGGVQITPLPFDHGHITVGIGVYNKGYQPINFGVENISATINGMPIAVLSSAELQKRAKSRAMWSQIGLAVLAGAAAAAASQAYTTSHYNGVMRTPHGTYSWASSYRDNSLGVLGATAAVAGGTAGIIGIQNRLDYTLDNLAAEIVQTTTIDPDASYGGRVVIEKDDKAKLPYDVRIMMSLNGTEYPFVFRVTKEGVNLPPPFVTPVSTMIPSGMTGPAVADHSGASASPSPLTPPVPARAAAPLSPTN
jgi:hypothetical protein